jgi:hypothetical protein
VHREATRAPEAKYGTVEADRHGAQYLVSQGDQGGGVEIAHSASWGLQPQCMSMEHVREPGQSGG